MKATLILEDGTRFELDRVEVHEFRGVSVVWKEDKDSVHCMLPSHNTMVTVRGTSTIEPRRWTLRNVVDGTLPE